MVIIMVLIQIACVLRHQVEQNHLPQERYLLSSDGVFLKWGYHNMGVLSHGVMTWMVLGPPWYWKPKKTSRKLTVYY